MTVVMKVADGESGDS